MFHNLDFDSIVQREFNGWATASEQELLWQASQDWLAALDTKIEQAKLALTAKEKEYKKKVEARQREEFQQQNNAVYSKDEWYRRTLEFEEFEQNYEKFTDVTKKLIYKATQKKNRILSEKTKREEKEAEDLRLHREFEERIAEQDQELLERARVSFLINWKRAYKRAFYLGASQIIDLISSGEDISQILDTLQGFAEGPLAEWASDENEILFVPKFLEYYKNENDSQKEENTDE